MTESGNTWATVRQRVASYPPGMDVLPDPPSRGAAEPGGGVMRDGELPIRPPAPDRPATRRVRLLDDPEVLERVLISVLDLQ